MDPSLLKIAGNIASVDIRVAKKGPSKKKAPKRKVSKRKPAKKKPARSALRSQQDIVEHDISVPKTEYSVQMDITLSVEFEGNAEKNSLLSKLKKDLISAIESGVTATARSLDLAPSNLRVKPLKANFTANDPISLEEEDDFL